MKAFDWENHRRLLSEIFNSGVKIEWVKTTPPNGERKNMTPKQYQNLTRYLDAGIKNLQDAIDTALSMTEGCPLPLNLRPATHHDIIEGAILWYKHGDNGHFWQIVEEVMHPRHKWKAYCAESGCRYGLEDAYVELEGTE